MTEIWQLNFSRKIISHFVKLYINQRQTNCGQWPLDLARYCSMAAKPF